MAEDVATSAAPAFAWVNDRLDAIAARSDTAPARLLFDLMPRR